MRVTLACRRAARHRRPVCLPDRVDQRAGQGVPRQRIFYLGDWDWCGLQIEENTKRTLREHSGLSLTGLPARIQAEQFDARWERVALTETQVAKNNLPRITKADKRYRPARYFDAVETEAFGQARIVDAVQARLDELIPEPLDDVLERQERQRGQVAERLRSL